MASSSSAQVGLSQKPIHISIEANIGAGKTTILHDLVEYMNNRGFYFKEIPEPVEEWRDFHGQNVLEKYYQEPEKNSFLFQSMAVVTKVDQLRSFNHKQVMVERSLRSQQRVFIPVLRQKGLDPTKVLILYDMIRNMEDLPGIRPDIFIYLKVSAETCLERIKIRGRDEEKGITLEYLQALENCMDNWLVHDKGASLVVLTEQYRTSNALMKFITDEIIKILEKRFSLLPPPPPRFLS